MNRPLCLFAHYDKHNLVDPYVFRYLMELKACDFDLVFITTASISSEDKAKLENLCHSVIIRENNGLDFGSWAAGYQKYGHGRKGEILIANDSVYGPLTSLKDALQNLRSLKGDVSGMAESFEHRRHLQSWFVLLSEKAHQSEVFQKIMAQDFGAMQKTDIIKNGEIDLSHQLGKAGFKVVSLSGKKNDRQTSRSLTYNPTHILWKELIEDYQIPFLKIELMRDNPLKISNLWQWREIVGERSPELLPMIESHCARLRHNWAGAEKKGQKTKPFSLEAFVKRDLHYYNSKNKIAGFLNKLSFQIARLYGFLNHQLYRCLVVGSKIKRSMPWQKAHR